MTRLDDCLSEAQRCCFKNSSTVDILEYMGDGKSQWVQDKNLSAFLSAIKTRGEGRSSVSKHPAIGDGNAAHCQLRLFFISATIGDNGLHTHIDPILLKLLHEESNMSAKFIIDLFQTEDWTVFPTCFTFSKPGEVPSRSTLQYGFWSWGENATHSFVQLVIEPDVMTYYFVNFTRELKEFIETSLKDCSGSRVAPVLLDYWILTQLLSSYRRGLGTQRLKLRQIEHDDDESTVQNQARELHELCRTWHVMLKDFGDLEEHTRQLKAFGRRLNTTYHNIQSHRRDEVLETIDSLVQFEDNCKFWASWAKTYLDRTNICINLAHHLENKEMASQVRRESISMFTLAIVTVIFLPSTFVASILGTNFFNFDGMVFTVSSLWWILLVTSIPLTLAVILFWYKWSKTRSEKTRVQFTGEQPEKRAWDLPDPVRQMRKLMP